VNLNPAHPVFEQSQRTPEALALAADGVELTYGEVVLRASSLAAVLRDRGIGRGSRVGILGSRSLIALQAVLGVAWIGASYVPLGLRWPEQRLKEVLARVALDAMVVDERGLDLLTENILGTTPLLVVPDDDAAQTRARGPGGRILSLASLPRRTDVRAPASMAADDLSYVIFTSGTTGVPKGVMVAAGSVAAYLTALGSRKALTPADRASQFSELSFDPSLGEIFLPWSAGASIHVVPALSQVSPAKFIRDRALTIWGSTPSAIAWMRDTRSLQPGSLPGLRYTSFGGEPLSLASVRAWQAAAPNSVIDNLYGPTEATVDCVGQRIEPGATPIVTPGRGVLAIGTPHPGTELAVLGPDLRPMPDGEAGELAIAGSQLTVGYLDSPALTTERFPRIDGKRWYLTGDIAVRDAGGTFHHLGRIDNQIKLQGHRVELEEIEAHVRAVTGSDQVAVVAWPVGDGVAHGIVGFVSRCGLAPGVVREALRPRLPSHMVPARIHEIDAIPLDGSGKLDRRKLVSWLEAGVATAGDRSPAGRGRVRADRCRQDRAVRRIHGAHESRRRQRLAPGHMAAHEHLRRGGLHGRWLSTPCRAGVRSRVSGDGALRLQCRLRIDKA
jgi:amino acid adenylation domain-containing protein